MKKSELANKIQILLESIGYCGNSDDGERIVELLVEEGLIPPPYRTRLANGLEVRLRDWEPEQ